MTSILYSHYNCPHSLKTAFFLSIKGVSFERVEIDLSTKQQKTPAYLAKNANGTTPAYEHDGGVLGDSLEIMRYIDEHTDTPKLFPTDPQKFAEVLAWIKRANEDFWDVSHHLYWQLLDPPQEGTDWDEVKRLKNKGIQLLSELESILSTQPYIIGDLSTADIVIAPWVYGYKRFDLPENPEDFPHVRAWLDKLTNQPAFTDNYQVKGVPFLSS